MSWSYSTYKDMGFEAVKTKSQKIRELNPRLRKVPQKKSKFQHFWSEKNHFLYQNISLNDQLLPIIYVVTVVYTACSLLYVPLENERFKLSYCEE